MSHYKNIILYVLLSSVCITVCEDCLKSITSVDEDCFFNRENIVWVQHLMRSGTTGISVALPDQVNVLSNGVVEMTFSDSSGGVLIPLFTTAGVVHNNTAGLLSTSLIVDADIDALAAISDSKLSTISSVGKVANSATTATSSSAADTIVLRDSSNNFSANVITAALIGTVTGNVTGAASLNVLKSGDTMSGDLVMDNQKQIRLNELSINGAHHAALQAPETLSSNYTLTLPTSTGSVNQVLTTDGSGNLSWQSVAAPIGSYRAQAYISSNFTTNSTSLTVPFNTTTFDPNNNFNTSTSLYTAPATGIYLVSSVVSITAASASATRRAQLLKNGSVMTGYSVSSTTNVVLSLGVATMSIPLSLCSIVSLNAGDTLGVRYTGTNGDVLLAGDTNFSIQLLS